MANSTDSRNGAMVPAISPSMNSFIGFPTRSKVTKKVKNIMSANIGIARYLFVTT